MRPVVVVDHTADRDDQTERGLDERFRDTGGHGTDAAQFASHDAGTP
jgi:hypothetical protein